MTALGQLQERADPPDHNAAADWYEKAHDKGDVVGTTNLAHAFVKGQGREENWARARLLYTEAAAQGYPRAFNDLGVMHQLGYGVAADALTAYSFFERSVDSGYAKAGVNIAELIISARFPFSSNHAAMGYCIWALERASDSERAGFQEDCDALDEIIQPDEATRSRARRFADRLKARRELAYSAAPLFRTALTGTSATRFARSASPQISNAEMVSACRRPIMTTPPSWLARNAA